MRNLANEAVGRPRRKRDAPRRFENAPHLGDGALGLRREHVPELTQHDVERPVGKRKMLDVALDPLDVGHPGDARVLGCFFQQRRRQIDSADAGPRARRRDGGDPRAGAHVENPLAGRNARETH